MLRGNAADSNIVDDSSHLSEPDSEDKHWGKGKRFSSIIIIYHLRTI